MHGSNVATLGPSTAEEAAAVNADRIACLIRWECRDLQGRERQMKAQERLAKLSPEVEQMVREALARRAGSDCRD